MRRALVISLVVHALVLVSIFEFRLLPVYSASATKGRVPLTVDFAALKTPEGVTAGHRRDTPTTTVLAERHSGRRVPSMASNERRPSDMPAQVAHQPERSLSPPLASAESMIGLPAEVESAYRLNIARELRRTGLLSQHREQSGQAGSVRLIISYWAGLYAPVVSVDHSSGHSELDEMALSNLKAAVARVQLPGLAAFRMAFVVEYRQAQ